MNKIWVTGQIWYENPMYRSSKVKIPDILIIIIKKADTEKKNRIYERKWMIYTNPKIFTVLLLKEIS